MKSLRVGLVGCGGISFSHALAMARVRAVRIAAVAEPKTENRDRFIGFTTPGIERRVASDEAFRKAVMKVRKMTAECVAYEKYERMLEREPLDAVLILTPHTLHHRQILDALDAGLHVLVEKPMVCTVPHAEKVVEAARKSGKVLGVAYQRHVEPNYVYMREAVRSRKLGKIEYMSFLLCQSWYEFTKHTWRRSPKLAGGGQLMDSGSHIVDAMLWVSGLKPKRVFAKIRCLDARVDINSALTVEFANGAIGQVSIVGKTVIPFSEEFMITGSDGVLHYESGRLSYYDGSGARTFPRVPRSSRTTPVSNFVDAIGGRAEIAAPPEWGLAVARLTEAAFRSAERGTYVNV